MYIGTNCNEGLEINEKGENDLSLLPTDRSATGPVVTLCLLVGGVALWNPFHPTRYTRRVFTKDEPKKHPV